MRKIPFNYTFNVSKRLERGGFNVHKVPDCNFKANFNYCEPILSHQIQEKLEGTFAVLMISVKLSRIDLMSSFSLLL